VKPLIHYQRAIFWNNLSTLYKWCTLSNCCCCCLHIIFSYGCSLLLLLLFCSYYYYCSITIITV